MFAKSIEHIDEILDDAKKSPLIENNERIRLYNTVIDYVKEHNLIISNHLLYLDKKDMNSVIIIYGPDILRHANDIANILSGITIYIKLFTTVKSMDFNLSVYGMPFIQLYGVHTKIYPNIFPIVMDGLNVYPPELELINVYNKLYLPEYSDKWDCLLEAEYKLFNIIKDRGGIIGGKPKQSYNLLEIIKKRDDYVLIGNVVLDVFRNGYGSGKVHIITNSDLKLISNELCNTIYKQTGKKHIFKIENVGFPGIPRLSRSNIKSDGKIVCVIYNPASYELIPYTVYKNTKIAHVSVICMYMLLDAWHLREVYSAGTLDKKTMDNIMSNLFKTYTAIRDIPIEMYTQELYFGQYSNIINYRIKQKKDNEFPPYIPEKYKLNSGNYRIIRHLRQTPRE